MEFRQDDLTPLTSRLLTLVVTTLLITALFAGHGVALSTAEDEAAVPTQDPNEATISPEVQSASGTVQVVVRLSAVELPETDDRDVLIEQMKAQTEESQTVIRDLASDTEGVSVLGDFWLANAVLLEVDTSEFDPEQLTTLDGVTQVHENEQELETTRSISDIDPQVETTTEQGSSRFDVSVGMGSTVHQLTGQSTATTRPGQTTEPLAGEGEYTYGLEDINVPEAWNQFNTQGSGATVAVLDTGIDASHPDLDLDKWAEFDASGDEVPSNPSDFGSHGTHVSGTLAGGDASGTAVGVAPNVELLASPALGGGWGRTIAAMQWAVENDADVMNLSFGIPATSGSVYAPRYIEPIQNAINAQTLVVTSAGNSGDGRTGSPANIYSAISVGNVDSNGNVDSDSSGEVVDTSEAWGEDAPGSWPEEFTVPTLAAPGSNVYSTLPTGNGDQYGTLSGTSMAAPHVSGVAALMDAATQENLGPTEIREALEETADGPNSPNTREGYGIVDAQAAIEAVVDDPPNETITVETTDASDVGTTSATLEGDLLELGESGSAEVSFEYGADGEGFTDTTAVQTKSSTGSFEVPIDGLEPGTTYQFRALAESDSASDQGFTREFTTESDSEPPQESVSVETAGTTDVGTSSVTLQGELTELTGADSAEVSFEYGTDGFSETTTVQTRSSTGSFEATIDGLQSDTEYQFRAVAEIDSDSDTGSTQTFTTDRESDPDPDPGSVAVETTDAFRVTESTVTLVGELTELDGADSAELSFEYGTDGLTETTSVTTRNSAGFYQIDISGLESGTEYQFRAVAEAGSASDTGSTKTFTTEGDGGEDPPSASVSVETRSATGVSDSSATLRGRLTELTGVDSAEVSFEYGTEDFSQSTTVQTRSSTGSFEATIDGLQSDTEYQFRAIVEADGASDTAGTRTFRTTSDGGSDPSPGTVSVETTDSFRVSDSSATLVGELTELDGADSAELSFEYGTDSFSKTTSVTTRQSTGFYQVDISGLESGTEYQFRAVADADGASDTGSTKRFTTEGDGGGGEDPPSASVDVNTRSAVSVGESSATLRGSLTELTGVDSAEVSFEYGIGDFSQSTTVETRTSTGTFRVPIDGLESDAEYQFRAVAEADGASDTGSRRVFTTESGGSDPPSKSVSVATLDAVDVSSSAATLRGKVTELTGAESVEVSFEYGAGGLTETTTVQTKSSTGTFEVTLNGLQSDTDYEFRAVAETDSASDTGGSREFTTKQGGSDPDPGTLSVETNTAYRISESSVTLVGELTEIEGADSAEVSFEYGSNGLTQTSSVKTLGSTDFYQIEVTGLESGTEYQFRAVAEAGSASATGETQTFTTEGDSNGGGDQPSESVSVVTLDAVDVSSSSATLRGKVTELTSAESVEVSFNYGHEDVSQRTTRVQTLDSTGSFEVTIDGLDSDTDYEFRAVAETDAASDTGGIRVLSTRSDGGSDPGSVTVETTDAFQISDSSATLVGDLKQLDGANSAELYFEYGTNGFTQQTETVRTRETPGFYQLSITGLESGTEYQFRAVAEADGASDTGSTKRFTTE
jgi:subtilisin